MRFTDDLATSGEAVLTSSAAHEQALESREIRASFFSHHFVSGLRGATGSSGDGRVTIGEAYRYAFVNTLLATSNTLTGPQDEQQLVRVDVPGIGVSGACLSVIGRRRRELRAHPVSVAGGFRGVRVHGPDAGRLDLHFIAVDGWMDCRFGKRDGQPLVEFSWQGSDEADEAMGRGWACRDLLDDHGCRPAPSLPSIRELIDGGPERRQRTGRRVAVHAATVDVDLLEQAAEPAQLAGRRRIGPADDGLTEGAQPDQLGDRHARGLSERLQLLLLGRRDADIDALRQARGALPTERQATSKHAAPKGKALNIRALVDYIAGPAAGGDGEKVEYRGALNLLNIDHDAQVQEMIDLAEIPSRSPQPVQHWILSWREGEQPSLEQADQAITLFLEEMGLAGHQAIYALHRNTRNCHLHLAVNCVHPDTEKVVTVNAGFDHEVAHRAIARIEQRQGWQPEDRALFIARPDGDLSRSHPREVRESQPSSRARDFEERVGDRSAQRIAIEIAAPIMRQARSWSDMHLALARERIRFERKGSGAILWIGDEAVKASSAGRECSMAALEKRLGGFTSGPALPPASERPARAPQPIEDASAFWTRYAAERLQHQRQRAGERHHRVEQDRDQWRRLVERHRRERVDLLHGSWRGRGALSVHRGTGVRATITP